MKRRTALTMTGLAFSTTFVGCLSVAPEDAEEQRQPETSIDTGLTVEIKFTEQDGETSGTKREQILIRNTSGEAQSLSGYTLTYSSGYEYTFSGGLSLEPQSSVAIVSRGTGDYVAESDPPKYYRDANLSEFVLEDGKETVRLLNQENEVVVEASYNAP